MKLLAVLPYIPRRNFQSQGDWNDSIARTHVSEPLQKGEGMWNIQLNVGKWVKHTLKSLLKSQLQTV